MFKHSERSQGAKWQHRCSCGGLFYGASGFRCCWAQGADFTKRRHILLSVISCHNARNRGQEKTSINLSSSHPGFLDPQPTQHHIRASAAENQQPDHLHRPRLHSMRWVSRRMCDGKRKHVFETFAQICADTCLVRIPNLCGETAACVQSKKKQETCKFSTNIKFQSRKDKPR